MRRLLIFTMAFEKFVLLLLLNASLTTQLDYTHVTKVEVYNFKSLD